MSDLQLPVPRVNVARLASKVVDRIPESRVSWLWAVAATVSYAAPTGESVIDVTVGDGPDQYRIPAVRYSAAFVPAIGDRVLLQFFGDDPYAVDKVQP